MDIADVKKELSSDEKVLENVFKLETIYKKYKFIVWAVVVGILAFFVGRSVLQSMNESKLIDANTAFMTLQKDPKDGQALATLKEKNPKLFELYTYTQAVKNEDKNKLASLATSSNEIVSDASAYAENTLNAKPQESQLYKEMALYEEAYLAIKAKNMKLAKDKLDLIGENSPLHVLAALLKHSTIKAN